MILNFKVIGKPKGQPRTRACTRGGHAGVYTPGVADDWKALCVKEIEKKLPEKPYDYPMWLRMDFYFTRPKSHYGSGRNSNLIKNSAPYFHLQKPDVDNMAKCVMDVMTTIGFIKDDTHIVECIITKNWTDGRSGMNASLFVLDEGFLMIMDKDEENQKRLAFLTSQNLSDL